MKPWRKFGLALDDESSYPQLCLPFPVEKTIDTARCRAILHVGKTVIYRLVVTPIAPGSDAMCLTAYNTAPRAPLRIKYTSIVGFLSTLRERHGIQDRRPAPIFGRYRDDDLLPFPWADTINVNQAAEALNLHPSKVLLRIESGQVEAYQIAFNAPWRVSRSSVARLIHGLTSSRFGATPYAGKRITPERVGSK